MLDRHCYAEIEQIESTATEFPLQPNLYELIREGYRNVVIQEPSLEGASVEAIHKRHIQWVEERGFPRRYPSV